MGGPDQHQCRAADPKRFGRARAGEKHRSHRKSMMAIKTKIEQSKAEKRESPKAPSFAPAGQSTQMIVGATPANDATIFEQASSIYREQRLRRVYYSAFSPIPMLRANSHLRAAARARASALSGRLADALLRLRCQRDHHERAARSAARHRSEARVGVATSRQISRSI